MLAHSLQRCARYALSFLRWAVISVAIGCLCGVVGGLFAIAVEAVTHLRQQSPWLIWLLPVGGLAIVWLYRLLKLPLGMGTDDILEATRTQGKVSIALAPAIFASTVVTHMVGGSAGREGAALQLGGSLGAAVGSLLHPKADERRICTLCGMAALFSALFGTPLTAAVFVLEIVEVGRFNHRGLMPCVLSAISAKLAARAIGAPQEVFPLASHLADMTAGTALQSALVGAACGVTAILFCFAMHLFGKLYRRYLPNAYLRIASGGAVVLALTLLIGRQDYNGGGMHIITAALGGQAVPYAFLLKILLTALTLGAGYKGGEIVPSFFVGATLGCSVAGLMDLSPAVGAALGMLGLFCGVTNAPLASVLLSVELFGAEYLPLMGIAIAVSFMLSGHCSLYHTQHFAMPKMGHEG